MSLKGSVLEKGAWKNSSCESYQVKNPSKSFKNTYEEAEFSKAAG